MQSTQASRDFYAAQSEGFDYEAVYDDDVSPDHIYEFDYGSIEGEDAGPADVKLAMEFLKRVLLFVRSEPNRALTIDCIFLATGDAANDNKSLTAIAKEHGLTKQAVSMRVKELQKALNLPRARMQKSAAASKSYDVGNWRPLPKDT